MRSSRSSGIPIRRSRSVTRIFSKKTLQDAADSASVIIKGAGAVPVPVTGVGVGRGEPWGGCRSARLGATLGAGVAVWGRGWPPPTVAGRGALRASFRRVGTVSEVKSLLVASWDQLKGGEAEGTTRDKLPGRIESLE